MSLKLLRTFTDLAICLLPAGLAQADTIVFEQPHSGTGVVYQSGRWDPDGSDYDSWVWDGFTLPQATAITEIRWRGGRDPAYLGMGGPIIDFRIQIWSSIVGGSQPDIGSYFQPNPLLQENVGGNANEVPAGTFGGVAMYDYSWVLPSPFQAQAGVEYWVQIEAWQSGIPDWGIAKAASGDNGYFRLIHGDSALIYQLVSGDATFSLIGAAAATVNITADVSPIGAGSVSGAGPYPIGSLASLTANPLAGYGFFNWTENGVQVSANPTYAFTATVDRALVANFVAAYTITTSVSPSFGGTTSGDGVYNEGMPVNVQAFANPGFTFSEWTWLGNPMSASPSYTFPATADMNLVANFTTATTTVTFDFENAPVHTSLPLNLTVDGLTAHFTATGSGFSVQAANTMGFTPPGFAGLCLYPNSVFAADLLVSFSQHLTDFSILYSPQELGCDDSARMRVTAYFDGAFVATATTTAQFPGTWPSETLRISPPGEFNSVLIHYDARPPTCQDWGPIFMADNMIVNRVAAPALPETPLADPSGHDKSRFITFSIPASASSAETALRVQLVSLHHVVPPYTGGVSIPFTAFEGQSRWVGPPVTYVESNSSGLPFQASALQCTPYYLNWSTISILHVTGSAIVPSSIYEVENLAASCAGVEATCADVSGILTVKTTRWADVEIPFNPPDASLQPDLADISALVNKFRNQPGALIKARAMLAGMDVYGNIEISPDLNFMHIAACVDAFRGQPYPYALQSCP